MWRLLMKLHIATINTALGGLEVKSVDSLTEMRQGAGFESRRLPIIINSPSVCDTAHTIIPKSH